MESNHDDAQVCAVKIGKARSRAFFLTINKDLEAAIVAIKRTDAVYIAISPIEEAPTTGHKHFHAYLYFENQRNLSRIIKIFNAYGDVEIPRSPIGSILNYLTKTGPLQYEEGIPPQQGRRNDLVDALHSCKTLKEFRDKFPDIFLRYHNGVRDYFSSLEEEEVLDAVLDDVMSHAMFDGKKMVQVIYITGIPGAGKTTASYLYALERLGYVKKDIGTVSFDENGFCKGTRIGAKCLIWNEFRDKQIRFYELLQLCDQYGYAFNVKGGKVVARPETIIFNSSIMLEELYTDINENLGQLYRRITKYFVMDDNYNLIEQDEGLDQLRARYRVKMPTKKSD